MTKRWIPTNEVRKVMEAVWMQVENACEELKEETNATELHVAKMLQEMADLYHSK